MKFTNIKIKPKPGVWVLKLDFELTGSKGLATNCTSRTLVPIFKNKSSFYVEC